MWNMHVHIKNREYTFFSMALGTFTKFDYILGYKVSLNKC